MYRQCEFLYVLPGVAQGKALVLNTTRNILQEAKLNQSKVALHIEIKIRQRNKTFVAMRDNAGR